MAKWTRKILLWGFTSIVVLLVLAGTLLLIPAVQTFVAHKVAAILSEEMQTEVSIGKLRVDFGLNIKIEDIRLNDLYGNNLISAKKGSLNFPSFNTKNADIEIKNIVLEEADVTFRRYGTDTALNLQFFVDFIKERKQNDKKNVIDLHKIQLKNSRFQLKTDALAGENTEGVWNYSNMIIENINLKMDLMRIIGDSLNMHIAQLSATERSGFQINKFSGHLMVCRKEIHCLNTNFSTKNKSKIAVDFRFDYTDFSDFQDFSNKIIFNTDLYESWLNLTDLIYFVPSFKGMNDFVHLSARVKGSLSDCKIKKLDLSYGQATEIKGDIDLQGLPVINETFIDCTIEKLKTNISDLALFTLPKGKKIPIPDVVKKVQWIETQGHFLGLYNNFFADATFSTALGDASCELMLNILSQPISYDGKLQTNNLALGTLLNNSNIGHISMTGQIVGQGVTIEDMDFSLQSTVSSITFRNNTVNDIVISGDFLSKQFDGQVDCSDEDLKLKFKGLVDFNQEEVNYNFEAFVYALNLSNFQLFRPDSNVIVSAYINMDIMGKDIDHFRGKLQMKDIVYQENNTNYVFPDFALNIQQQTYPNKNITLKSDILNADMSGQFTYKQAFTAVQKNLHTQLPNVIPCPMIDSATAFNQNVKLSLNLTKSIPLLEHFLSDIRINDTTRLHLRIDKGIKVNLAVNQLLKTNHISVELPQLDLNNKHRLTHLSIVNQQNTKMANLGVTCRSYFTNFAKQDSIPEIQNFDFQAVVNNNVIDFLVTAMGNEKNKLNDVLLEGSVAFLDMKKREMEIMISNGAVVWDAATFLFDASNSVYLAKDSLFIRNIGLQAQDGRSIAVHSGKTERGDNAILFDFNKINLEILDVYLHRYQIALGGEITGKGGLIRNAYGYALGSNFEINDFQFNNIDIGFLQGRTYWNNVEKKLFMQTSVFENKDKKTHSLLAISGNFDPKEKYIDLVGQVDSLNVKVLEPYLRSFASRVEGFGTGKLSFKGKISDPKLTGSIALKNAVLGIDFLKTNYYIDNGKIDFVDTGFIFNNLSCRDAHHGKGIVNGIITHNRLRNFGVNLKIDAVNLLVLNTTMKDNTLFYGRAFATGTASITGRVNDVLSISADVTTNSLTDITLSLDWNITVKESEFIRFVSYDEQKKKSEPVEIKPQSTAMEVNFKITATPDAQVRILLDPTIGGTITGRGSGTIEMALDKNGNFNMYGPYTISSGDFNIAFLGVLNRTLKIENGGTISWNGDPTQGTINVRAVQTTKVPIPSDPNEGAVEGTRYRPVSVNNILSLNGRLLNPNMSFSFTLPDADETISSKLYRQFDTTNREEMVKQVLSVLFMGKFDTPKQEVSSTAATGSNTGANTAVNTTIYSATELISAQINKIVSSISDKFDIRPIYRLGEEAGESEYGVDVGGRLFNDRVNIRTSFGRLEQQDVDEKNRFLGDATVELNLLRDGSLKAKAFNITNPQDVLSTYSSNYSQGAGLTYSKEFDTLKELFARKKPKKEKNRKEKKTTPPMQPIALPEEEE